MDSVFEILSRGGREALGGSDERCEGEGARVGGAEVRGAVASLPHERSEGLPLAPNIISHAALRMRCKIR